MKDHGLNLRRYASVDCAQRLGRLVNMLDHYGGRDRRVKRYAPAQHFVEHDTYAVDISTAIEFLSQALLGRHVVWRAHDAPGLREMARHVIAQLGNAEVEYLDPQPGDSRIDDDVVWFDIAMNDVATVGLVQRCASLIDYLGGSRGS